AVALTAVGAELVAELRAVDDSLVRVVELLGEERQEAVVEGLLTIIAGLVREGAITVARTCLTCRFHRFDSGAHHCTLLDIPLLPSTLRVNCPEHEQVAV